jgi:antitoxin FitA
MQNACMNKHIHIRDFDAVLHEKLVQRAQSKHMSLSQYLRNELAQLASRPSLDEVLDRLKKREPVHLNPSAAEMIRADRDSR